MPDHEIGGPACGQEKGRLLQVLTALRDPVRMEMVRRLWNRGEPVQCLQLYEQINKSTASHHFRVLQEAGLIERSVTGGVSYQRLRTSEINAAMPGLLKSIIDQSNREASAGEGV